MFTGIVVERGVVVALTELADAARLSIRGPQVTVDAALGDSISVNGVCLTIAELADDVFTADVMAESLRRSSLGSLSEGALVNLEAALRPVDRMGGHIVQGHVDAVTTLLSRDPAEHWEVVRFALPADLAGYVVEKGSITLDGVSLTVSALGPDWFEVSLIPTTLAETTLGIRGPGDSVNVEVDIVAKYVERLLGRRG